jgi:Domain of unknown function (DUF6471)
MEQWNKKASRVLKAILARQGLKYADLATLLSRIGVKETNNTIANKLSRGSFSFAFFLQCMEVLNIENINLN